MFVSLSASLNSYVGSLYPRGIVFRGWACQEVINVKWGPKRGTPIWYGGLIGRGKDTWTLSPPWEDTAKRQLLEARKSAVTGSWAHRHHDRRPQTPTPRPMRKHISVVDATGLWYFVTSVLVLADQSRRWVIQCLSSVESEEERTFRLLSCSWKAVPKTCRNCLCPKRSSSTSAGTEDWLSSVCSLKASNVFSWPVKPELCQTLDWTLRDVLLGGPERCSRYQE